MQVTLVATIFERKKYHIYDCRTTGKHPVHLIEGGKYITEDKRYFGDRGDMGWFFLNQREYDLLKSNMKEMTIEVNEVKEDY